MPLQLRRDSHLVLVCRTQDNAVIYASRSAALLQLKRCTEALEDAQQAVRLRSRWPRAHLSCGDALVELGHLQAAAESYRSVLMLAPKAQLEFCQALSPAHREAVDSALSLACS
jgi:tetratricopeptide (TPR) repeat protein